MLRDFLMQKGLSNREIEVAELVSQGLANKEVAERLFVTEKTIKFHLTNIYKKMSVKSRAQLIVWCLPHLSFSETQKAGEASQQQPNQMASQQPVQDDEIEIPAGNSTVANMVNFNRPKDFEPTGS